MIEVDDRFAQHYKTGTQFAPSATVCAYLHADNQVNAGMAGRESCISVFCGSDCYFYTEINDAIVSISGGHAGPRCNRTVLSSIKSKEVSHERREACCIRYRRFVDEFVQLGSPGAQRRNAKQGELF